MRLVWRCYLADPLAWVGFTTYLLNRVVLKRVVYQNSFTHGHLNDVLLIPCALPPLLFAYRRLGLRKHDRPPTWTEIAFHFVAWSPFFEWVGPACMHRGIADKWDVASYAAGALIAGAFWNSRASAGWEARPCAN